MSDVDFAALERKAFPPEEPEPVIDDLYLALVLLEKTHARRTDVYLKTYHPRRLVPPYIGAGSYCGAYDSLSSTTQFPVSFELALQLEQYTEGTPHWGYTDATERRINRRGEDFLFNWRQQAKQPCTSEVPQMVAVGVGVYIGLWFVSLTIEAPCTTDRDDAMAPIHDTARCTDYTHFYIWGHHKRRRS